MPDMTRSRFSIPWVCGALAIFVCMMWGMDFVLIKLGYSQFSIASSDTGSILMFAGTRFILSGIMTLAVLSAVKRKLMLLRKSNVVNACMLALFQTVGQYVLLYLGMHVQVVWQIVFLEDQFEAPCECRRRHRLIKLMLSEQKVVVGYSPSLIVKSLALAVAAVLFQQRPHLR